jgi:ubiquinone/menaquinone biosynthesis C-methylase UbiE
VKELSASFAPLEPGERRLKAEKIRRLVETVHPWEGARVLEVGTGAGVIPAALAEAVGPKGEVQSVDIADDRVEKESFEFHLVEGVKLPFSDTSFDVVLSNHVFEHVGDLPDQREHLSEIRRVLREDGVLYLATATRWLVMEPHYRLPFLSWLPHRGANAYLRATGRGEEYDVHLPTHRRLRQLLAEAGYRWKEPYVEAMRLTAEIERPGGIARRVLSAPGPVLRTLRPIVPTIIILARKA